MTSGLLRSADFGNARFYEGFLAFFDMRYYLLPNLILLKRAKWPKPR